MIDVEVEQLIPLTQARKHPAFRNPRTGKAAHASTVFRHALYGGRAVTGERIKLETVKLPSGLVTSAEAIKRFIAALTDPGAEVPASRNSQRQRELDQADAALASAGMI